MRMKPELVPEGMLEHVAQRFRVLGDSTRLSILRALMANGEMNVGELVDQLHMSQANVSKHLRILHEARVVARRREGTSAYYSVIDPSIVDLCDLVCERMRQDLRAQARLLHVGA